jgi:hypothetical protein
MRLVRLFHCWIEGENLQSHGIASNPTAKKKLKRKSITVATYPADLVPFATVPANIAMEAH